MKKLITISREYGSGGRIIGKLLAERLGVPFYDKEIIDMAVEESGFSRELMENAELNAKNSFAYNLASALNFSEGINASPLSVNEKMFLAQFQVISQIGKTNEGVIVGRCADYALADFPNVVNVYLYADMQSRIARIARRHDVTDAKAKDLIQKTDKGRASYYNYYTNKKWSDAESYELCLTSSELGIEGTAQAIIDYVTLKEKIGKESRKI